MERDIEITTLLAEDLNRYFERLVLSYQDQLYAFVRVAPAQHRTTQHLCEAPQALRSQKRANLSSYKTTRHKKSLNDSDQRPPANHL